MPDAEPDKMEENSRHGPAVRLTVDLEAIAANWLLLKKRLGQDQGGAGVDCAAVVKADAYGLGAVPVARALYDQGCRHFFVAWAAEGLRLLPTLAASQSVADADAARIYLLNGPWGLEETGASAADIAAAGLIPVLNSCDDLSFWAEKAPDAPAVVQVDTGMNRLGLSLTDCAEGQTRDLLRRINIRYLMSHLACADQPGHALNPRQLARFRQVVADLGRPLRLSFANSSGIFLGADYHFDLVRPGAALYGLNPQPGQKNPMRRVVSLSAQILQSRTLPEGETIGYGATYRVAEPEKHDIKPSVAQADLPGYVTLALGYADGLPWALSNRGRVVIAGTVCPIVGRVSMDTVVVDARALPRMPALGEWAEIIGPQQTVDDVAASAGTIGYEILTLLGRRFPPVYQGAG